MVSIMRNRNGKKMIKRIVMVMVLLLITCMTIIAQTVQGDSSSSSVMKYFGDGTIGSSTIKKVTPILVLDFDNKSGYKTGMIGRVAADAIAVELLKSTDYDVIHRSDVDDKIAELGYTSSLTWDQQVKLATELKTRIVISGVIKNIQIYKKKDGTYAEATIDVDVLSTLTKSPINGGNIIQRSSVKVGYSGNPDVLVQEALTAGAYQLLQQIQSRKTVIGSVMTTQNDEGIYIKGGKSAGFTPGMQVMTVRRDTITGKMHIKSVTDTIAIAAVDDDSGIAPGDRAFSVYIPGQTNIDDNQNTPNVSPTVKPIPAGNSNSNTINMGKYNRSDSGTTADNNKREGTGMKLLAIGAAVFLYSIIKTDNGKTAIESSTSVPQVSVISDAVATGYQSGAIVLNWASLGDRVVCYVIYRNGIPINVVPNSTFSFIDDAKSFAPGVEVKSNQWEIIIDSLAVDGPIKVPLHSLGQTDEPNRDNIYDNGTPISGTDTFSITTHYYPLKSGESATYQIVPVYKEFKARAISDPAGQPTEYQLNIGTASPYSRTVTLISPPVNVTPDSGIYPGDSGLFTCDVVNGADYYILQLSSSIDFNDTKTIQTISSGGGSSYSAIIPIKYLTDTFPGKSQIFWRFGIKIAGQNYYLPLNVNSNTSGYVFSSTHQFPMPATPPVLPTVRQTARNSFNGFGIKLPRADTGRGANEVGITADVNSSNVRTGFIHRR